MANGNRIKALWPSGLPNGVASTAGATVRADAPSAVATFAVSTLDRDGPDGPRFRGRRLSWGSGKLHPAVVPTGVTGLLSSSPSRRVEVRVRLQNR